MAREIQVHTWCDRHLGDRDEQVPGESVTVTLNSDPARRVDLCSQCYAELVEPLATLLAVHGAASADSPEPTRALAGTSRGQPLKCNRCDKVYVYAKALRDHLAGVHGIRSDRSDNPLECTECGAYCTSPKALTDHRRNVHRIYTQALTACPECGRQMHGKTGLATHRRVAHGATGAKTEVGSE